MDIPRAGSAELDVGGHAVALSHLEKPFWPARGIRKGDLLRYYADVAPLILPHIRRRPMVMKRYPDGAGGPFFFMKRTPTPRPAWLETCRVEGIDYPLIDDLAALLWVVNLGCIDLNPFYAPCDDVERPDVLHLDLDPGSAAFDDVRAAALLVREVFAGLGIEPLVKTSGGKGLHVYVPIVRGPTQREVWTFAKALSLHLAARNPALLTAEYKVARRPERRVLLDYNQNARGRTLASIYSVRPTPVASVSTPITWRELEHGARPEDFRIDNVRARLGRRGDLWAPVLEAKGRTDLAALTARLTGRPAPPRAATAPSRRADTAHRGEPARRRVRPR